jgi:hypothetical protein
MNNARLVPASSFCWNKKCPDFGKVDQGNVVKFGHTAKGTQRYQCKIIAWLQVAADHVEEIEALMLAN